MKGELANDDDFPPEFGDGEVHFSFGVAEDAHFGDFAAEPFDVLWAIAVLDAEQYEESGADVRSYLSVDFHGCFKHSLDDGAHDVGKMSVLRCIAS